MTKMQAVEDDRRIVLQSPTCDLYVRFILYIFSKCSTTMYVSGPRTTPITHNPIINKESLKTGALFSWPQDHSPQLRGSSPGSGETGSISVVNREITSVSLSRNFRLNSVSSANIKVGDEYYGKCPDLFVEKRDANVVKQQQLAKGNMFIAGLKL